MEKQIGIECSATQNIGFGDRYCHSAGGQMATRRDFLGLLVAAGAAIAGGIVAVPSLITAFSPVYGKRRRDSWRAVGRLSEFPSGTVKAALVKRQKKHWPQSVRTEPVFVWRPDETEVVVFSRSCTDLACPLNYDAGSGCYFCPCHGGIFSREGTVMAGPPPRPMLRFACRVREGVVEVDLASLPPVR
jgi:menaquinol-cytochrome c reductase iron-sulfur subunit